MQFPYMQYDEKMMGSAAPNLMSLFSVPNYAAEKRSALVTTLQVLCSWIFQLSESSLIFAQHPCLLISSWPESNDCSPLPCSGINLGPGMEYREPAPSIPTFLGAAGGRTFKRQWRIISQGKREPITENQYQPGHLRPLWNYSHGSTLG